MADHRKTSRRAFLAGSAAFPFVAFAAARMGSRSPAAQSDNVRVVPGTGGPVDAAPQSPYVSPAAATSSPGTSTITAAALYARPLHFTYARQDIGPTKPIVQPLAGIYDDPTLLSAFADVTNGITAIMPFFLNVTDLSGFQAIIDDVRGMDITIFPAVGADPVTDVYQIDDQYYKNIVDGYAAAGFDCVRLENMQGYFDTYGQPPIDRMIQYCISKGFKHIMLNPWPRVKPQQGGQLLTFNYPEVDGTIYQVQLNFDKDTFTELPDQLNEPANSTNWQGNYTRVNAVAQTYPDVEILINYEAAPQHKVLANRQLHYGDSETKMQITLDWIAGQNMNLHWCPPWTTAYDPKSSAIGTWSWIAAKLNLQT